MKKANIINGIWITVALFLIVASTAYGADITTSNGDIDFAINTNEIQPSDYYIADKIIAVDSVGYTWEKDFQFEDVLFCKQYENKIVNGTEQEVCANWDTQQELVKTVLATISLNNCNEGSWYRVHKLNAYTQNKDYVRDGGSIYGDYQCLNNKITFEVDSFSSYSASEINSLIASITLYYSFDDDNLTGSSPLDISGNGNDGSNTLLDTGLTGIANQSFNSTISDNGVTIPNVLSSVMDNDYTFGIWLKSNSIDATKYIYTSYGERKNRMSIATDGTINLQQQDGTVSTSAGTFDFDNEWHFIVGRKSSTLGTQIYYDNALVGNNSAHTTNNQVQAGSSNKIASDNNGANEWQGGIDEFFIYDRVLNSTEMEMIYIINNESFNPYTYQVESAPVVVNTSYLGIPLDVQNFTITSGDYTLFNSFSFNTSESNTFIGLLSYFNFLKTTGSGSSDVSLKVEINNVSIYDNLVRTVEKNQAGVSSFPPLLFNVSNGQHTLNFYAKKTGVGNVNIYNSGASMGQFISTGGSAGRGNITTISETFNSASLTSVYGKDIQKNVETTTYIAGTFSFSSENATEVKCRFEDGGLSPFSGVTLSGGDTKTMSLSYITSSANQTDSLNITCLSSTGASVSINGTFIEADMKDDAGKNIPHNFYTNESTNLTSKITLNAGHTDYIQEEIRVYNGTNLYVSSSVTFNSTTGAQTPSFNLNLSGSGYECFRELERYSSGSLGNVFFYSVCDGLTTGNSYNLTLGVDIATGESIDILDEAVSVFENTNFDITLLNTAPTISFYTPSNDETISGNYLISWNYSDVQGDASVINITITDENNSTVILENEPSTTTAYLFNTSTFSDGVYNVTIRACESNTTDQFCNEETINITIQQPITQDVAFSYSECPVESTAQSIVFIGLLFALMLVLVLGLYIGSGVLTTISGIGLIFISIYMSGCIAGISLIFTGIGVIITIFGIFMKNL